MTAHLDEAERLYNDGQLDAAERAFAQALAEAEQEHGPEHEALIHPLWGLMRTCGFEDDEKTSATEAAELHGNRAVALAERFWNSKPQETAALLTFHALLLRKNDRTGASVEAARRALALISSVGGDVREQLQWVVETLMFANRGREALQEARTLVSLEDAADGILLWRAHFMLVNCLRQAGHDEEALSLGRQFVERTGKGASSTAWKDDVRSWLPELEQRIRSERGT